jgi:uncharacterized protein
VYNYETGMPSGETACQDTEKSPMILQFTVQNFRSFHQEETLNLAAGPERRHHDHLIKVNGVPGQGLLKVAAIYGANAAGKSNLVKALAFMQGYIKTGPQAGEATGRQAFKLAPEAKTTPTVMTLVFLSDEVIYDYGFALDDAQVVEEWLVRRDGGRERRLFHRQAGPDQRVFVPTIDLDSLAQNEQDRDLLKVVERLARPNQLLLNALLDKSLAALSPVIKWLTKTLVILPVGAQVADLGEHVRDNEKFREFLIGALSHADTGIREVTGVKVPLNIPFPKMEDDQPAGHNNALPDEKKAKVKNFVNGILDFFDEMREDLVVVEVQTGHALPNGAIQHFKAEEESDGTQRFMHLVYALYTCQAKPVIYVIDELDRSLHTLLCHAFIKQFLQISGQAQLIFTSHDTNLLDAELLRRDEIWFAQKNEDGATHLSSLHEYRVRGDLQYERSYLKGRFGGIPLLRALTRRPAAVSAGK